MPLMVSWLANILNLSRNSDNNFFLYFILKKLLPLYFFLHLRKTSVKTMTIMMRNTMAPTAYKASVTIPREKDLFY